MNIDKILVMIVSSIAILTTIYAVMSYVIMRPEFTRVVHNLNMSRDMLSEEFNSDISIVNCRISSNAVERYNDEVCAISTNNKLDYRLCISQYDQTRTSCYK